jgi:hypothetical protein
VAALVNSEMLALPSAQVDTKWEAGADIVCKQADPASVRTQEMCDRVSAFRAQLQLTRATPATEPGTDRRCVNSLTRDAQ